MTLAPFGKRKTTAARKARFWFLKRVYFDDLLTPIPTPYHLVGGYLSYLSVQELASPLPCTQS